MQVTKEVKQLGDGNGFPRQGDKVAVKYTGSVLESGATFDSQHSESAFEFVVGSDEVLAGWNKAIRVMSLGERALLTIPAELAYGNQGRENVPAGATVVFDMELMSINGRVAAITIQELDQYQNKCSLWVASKLDEYDNNAEVAEKKRRKYENRDGYKDFLEGEVEKKMQSYEGAREFAQLEGAIDQDLAANNTLRRVRIYICPFAVCKHGMHDRGFLYFLTPSPMRDLYFQGGYDQLGRRLQRSVYVEHRSMQGFEQLLVEMPEMKAVEENLTKTVEEYDPTTHVVVLFLAGDGYCNVLKMQLVPDYPVCLNLAEDYIDKDKIQLNID